MRTLKYAILGLLNQESMSGYELMKKFESTLCEFWSAKHSQIYPELKKLTDEGCITYVEGVSANGIDKKSYSITKEGKADFDVWMRSETKMKATPKDVSRLKIFFANTLNEEERFAFLEDQKEQHVRRLKHLEHNKEAFENIPDQSDDSFGDYLVLMGAIMREKTTIEWLEKCIELM